MYLNLISNINVLPNMIYFEFNNIIYFNQIFQFVNTVIYKMQYKYICCNFVLGTNDHFRNSEGEATKFLKTKEINIINTFYNTYNWVYYHINLRSGCFGLDGPNLFQVIHKSLCNHILEDIYIICKKENIYYKISEDYLILDLISDELSKYNESEILNYNLNWLEFEKKLYNKFKVIYKVLKPIILDLKRPQNYWRIEEWENWKKRYL